jgi:hypothetical protein
LLAKYLTNSEYITEPKDFRQITSVLLALADVIPSVVPYVVSFIQKTADNIGHDDISDYVLSKIKKETNVYNELISPRLAAWTL